MPIFKPSKCEDHIETDGNTIIERRYNLYYLSEKEAIEVFKEHFEEKYTIEKRNYTCVKEETDGGRGSDEGEDE
jgi:hypothetical protein